jgi:hypothetical protein
MLHAKEDVDGAVVLAAGAGPFWMTTMAERRAGAASLNVGAARRTPRGASIADGLREA